MAGMVKRNPSDVFVPGRQCPGLCELSADQCHPQRRRMVSSLLANNTRQHLSDDLRLQLPVQGACCGTEWLHRTALGILEKKKQVLTEFRLGFECYDISILQAHFFIPSETFCLQRYPPDVQVCPAPIPRIQSHSQCSACRSFLCLFLLVLGARQPHPPTASDRRPKTQQLRAPEAASRLRCSACHLCQLPAPPVCLGQCRLVLSQPSIPGKQKRRSQRSFAK